MQIRGGEYSQLIFACKHGIGTPGRRGRVLLEFVWLHKGGLVFLYRTANLVVARSYKVLYPCRAVLVPFA